MSEVLFNTNGGNQSLQVWVTFERKHQDGWIQDGQIQDGQIQDGCHHQVKWEWMSLSQIELVWVKSQSGVRVFSEWYLREYNKVSGSKMAGSESNMTEFKMAAIIKLSHNELVKVFCVNVGNQSWQVWVNLGGNTKIADSKMAIFKMARIQDGCHHQVKWEWMSLSQIELVWVRVRVEWECFWVNLKRR